MQEPLFHLKIASREGIVFDGKVVSISSFNDKGEFDVLASHANFISLIKKSVVIIDQVGRKREVVFNNALMKVFQDDVKIYLGIEWFNSASDSKIAN